MAASISCRRDYVLVKLAARELRRTIRRFREQLQAETDPIAYYSLLADIAFAQAQLNELFSQVGEWEMRGGCLFA